MIKKQFRYSATDIRDVCDMIISNQTLSDAEAMAAFVIHRLDGACLEIDYEQTLEEHSQTNWEDSAVVGGYRQWLYQHCTQAPFSLYSEFNSFFFGFRHTIRLVSFI